MNVEWSSNATDGGLVVSPTDLTNFLACRHLTQLDLAVALGILVVGTLLTGLATFGVLGVAFVVAALLTVAIGIASLFTPWGLIAQVVKYVLALGSVGLFVAMVVKIVLTPSTLPVAGLSGMWNAPAPKYDVARKS